MHYEVRFIAYERNGGGNIKNGNIHFVETFTSYEAAEEFYDKLDQAKKNGDTNRLWMHYVWDGFLESVDGIYKITEEKVR